MYGHVFIQINQNELNSIGSPPVNETVLNVDSFNGLADIRQTIASITCGTVDSKTNLVLWCFIPK